MQTFLRLARTATVLAVASAGACTGGAAEDSAGAESAGGAPGAGSGTASPSPGRAPGPGPAGASGATAAATPDGGPGDGGRGSGAAADAGRADGGPAAGATDAGPRPPAGLAEPDRLPPVIPVIWIEVGGRAIGTSAKVPGKLRVIEDHDGTLKDPAAIEKAPPTLATAMGISVRGNFTAGLPKKQYALELRDEAGADRDLPILGLPAGSDFTLNASYTDHTFMRNPLTYAIGRELGRWASRFRYVEIFIDGKYGGLYILQEKVRRDKNRVDIARPAADATAGDVTGGYIFRLEGPGKGGARDFKSAAGRTWTYHYPTYLEITAPQKEQLARYVDAFEAAMRGPDFTDPQKGYRKWIDVASFVDYALVQDFTRNFDSYWKSHYFHKDADARDGRLRAGPIWDFDNAYGLAEFARESTGRLQTSIPDFWRRLWSDPGFQGELKCRWLELRKPGGPMTLERINAKLDLWDRHIAPARVRDNARWSYLGAKIFPNHLVAPTHDAHVAYLRKWIAERLAWVDANMPGTCAR